MKRTLIFAACIALASCGNEAGTAHLDCETPLETTRIDRPNERGYWLVSDSLFLFAGFRPFDPATCAEFGAEREGCSLADLAPPFSVYQTGTDDTLHVLKDGRSIPFELDDGYCDTSDW